MGLLEGISTRTPTTSSWCMNASLRPGREPGLDQCGMQPDGQGGQLADDLFGPSAASAPRARRSGATTCSTRPTSRSAAAFTARRCRGSRPNTAIWPPCGRWRGHRRRSGLGRASGPGRSSRARPAAPRSRPAATSSSARESRSSDGSRANASALGSPSSATRDIGTRGWAPGTSGGCEAAVEGVEVLTDDAKRQVMVALRREDVAQPLQVLVGELAIARWGPLRLDQPLGLQEPDLADRDVGEVRPQPVEDVADAHVRAGRDRRGQAAHWVSAGTPER